MLLVDGSTSYIKSESLWRDSEGKGLYGKDGKEIKSFKDLKKSLVVTYGKRLFIRLFAV